MEKIIVEANGTLTVSNLKDNPDRIQILIQKIENLEPIRSGGEEYVIDPSGSYTTKSVAAMKNYTSPEFRGTYKFDVWKKADKDKADEKKIPLEAIPKGTILLSAIEKTSDFKGGKEGGKGAGSPQTETVEAGQCIYCALEQEGQLDLVVGENPNLEEASKVATPYTRLGKGRGILQTLQEIENLSKKEWKECLIQIAQKLASGTIEEGGKSAPIVARGSKVFWHWRDSFVDSVETIYKNLEDKLPGKFDRYNPADIWYTDKDYNSIADVDLSKGVDGNQPYDTKSTKRQDLTDALILALNQRKVVGISLKKTTDPQIDFYNKKLRETHFNVRPDKKSVETLGSDMPPMVRSKGKSNITYNFDMVYVNEDGKKGSPISMVLQIRKNQSSYRAHFREVSGDHGDGSTGAEVIVHCLAKAGVPQELLEKCRPSYYSRDKILKEQEEYILNYPFLFEESAVQEAEEELNGVYPVKDVTEPEIFEDEETGKKVVGASYTIICHCLDSIVAAFNTLEDIKKREFIGRLARYAWSTHEDCCDFIKVH